MSKTSAELRRDMEEALDRRKFNPSDTVDWEPLSPRQVVVPPQPDSTVR